MASFYVQNFGCRATQADGAAIERQFTELGLKPAVAPEKAGIVVLNTCTVTSAADQDARAAIRRLRRDNPACQIVVTGCYAQRAPQEVASLPGVTAVIGNSHKHQVANCLLPLQAAGMRHSDESGAGSLKPEPYRQASGPVPPPPGSSSFVPIGALAAHYGGLNNEQPVTQPARLLVSDIFAHTELVAAPVFEAASDRTRPNLKVQDGCNNRCSFCIIPFVRGLSRSLPLAEVIREVNRLVAAGYREVVISGINLGRWGRDLELFSPPSSLASRASETRKSGCPVARFEDLVRAVLSETGLEKLRISSVEPMDWSDELLDLMQASPRIAQHAHVPMQSGSDRILRAMHRRYRPWHYREKVENIRSAMPSAAIGADVMVGFPGESDSDFDLTRRMIAELPLTYLHVFTYSSRPGTRAATMPNHIPVEVARERNRILRTLAAEKQSQFMNHFLGKTLEAITLRGCDGEATEALTDNYLKLRIRERVEPNQWMAVRVEQIVDGRLVGSVHSQEALANAPSSASCQQPQSPTAKPLTNPSLTAELRQRN